MTEIQTVTKIAELTAREMKAFIDNQRPPRTREDTIQQLFDELEKALPVVLTDEISEFTHGNLKLLENEEPGTQLFCTLLQRLSSWCGQYATARETRILMKFFCSDISERARMIEDDTGHIYTPTLSFLESSLVDINGKPLSPAAVRGSRRSAGNGGKLI